jgi:hypothetical protein
MLVHSPHLPLTVDYRSEVGITAEDEEGILLALKQRHRIRHFRLFFPVQNLQKLVMAIDEEFPILEYLNKGSPLKDNMVNTSSTKSTSPRAERLRLSNTISITPDCREPCHTVPYYRSPIRLLSTKCPAPIDFTYAPARESRYCLFIPFSQP